MCEIVTPAVLVAVALVLAAILVKRRYSYWTRAGIFQPRPSFPFGNMRRLILKGQSSGDCFRGIYDEIRRRGLPVGGFYFGLSPMLMVNDPELVRHVLVKDFPHFVGRKVYLNEEREPLSAHLFALEGPAWRNLRVRLTPTFTSAKMKQMFHTLLACGRELETILEANHGGEPIDIKDVLARFTTDVIGSCAFGIECNCLRDPDVKFKEYGASVFEPRGIHVPKQMLLVVAPNVGKMLGLKLLPAEINDFFMGIVKETVRYREENGVVRNDFMQLLMQLKNDGKLEDDKDSSKQTGLTIEQVAAQSFIFFLAGFETSSTTMTFCLYELATNPEVQEKLREEITSVPDGEFTYEGIMDMSYMEKVINETLRKYPALPFLMRGCEKDYTFPNTNYSIKKGDKIRISVLGLHRDPEYYPDPERFDPERFSEEGKAKRVPFTYLPFGEGPRVCIGLRFGMMQVKVGLAILLRDYRFTLNSKTTTPLVMEPNSFTMSTKGGIWLNIHKVN